MTSLATNPVLELDGVGHSFGALRAVDDLVLSIAPGEVMCLVGPSGCGKTTLLRIAAGLERLQCGRVAMDGHVVACRGTDVPPENRGVGMVFQDYALFPHLTVRENVVFGLHGMTADERRERVQETLSLFGMAHLADSFPHTLSGGQQQRVALARALAPKPRLLLLDEPFSDLDSRLRDKIRDETLHILKKSGSATLMVTHDPEEAMFMSDRIAVMCDGRIAQVARPVDIYFHPTDAFVASFFSDVNRLEGVVAEGRVATPFGDLHADSLPSDTEVEILIRPEALHLAWAGEGSNEPNVAQVTAARLLGRTTLIHLEMPGLDGRPLHLHSRVREHVAFAEGDAVSVGLDISQAFVFSVKQSKS